MADPPRQAALRPLPKASDAHPPVVPVATPTPTPDVPQALSPIPQRYSTREKDGRKSLACDEAPRVRVVLDAEMAASKSEAQALGERVILLDGAGTFGPLLDNERQLYNLDHHWSCERLFTLSTCEQSLMLVHSGLPLAEGDWTIYANDPDLDTVLALWCLLNHRRVRELRPEARDLLLPLLRLEGAIDSNGRDLAQLCGLPRDVLEATQQRIDELMVRELALKQQGAWASKDLYAHTLEMLGTLDAMIFLDEDFGDHRRVEEIYGHVEIAPGKVAVVCRDRSGIYTVEQHLKTHWGDQLAVIALENQPGVYTLRRITSLGGPELGRAYELLNRIDPAVDGRPAGKRWGGSHDIGGSPRPRGTQLASAEVLEVLERAYQRPAFWARFGRSAGAFALGLAFLLFWPLAHALPSLDWVPRSSPALGAAFELGKAALLALVAGSLGTRLLSKSRSWVFGWRGPAPGRWWSLAPLALLGALPLGGWLPTPLSIEASEFVAAGLAALALVTAFEIWFRGLVHGLLSLDFPIQYPGGPRFLSRANAVSTLAYAGTATALAAWGIGAIAPPPFGLGSFAWLGVVFGAALVGGLTLGAIRERSLSLFAGIGLQVAGCALSASLWIALG